MSRSQRGVPITTVTQDARCHSSTAAVSTKVYRYIYTQHAHTLNHSGAGQCDSLQFTVYTLRSLGGPDRHVCLHRACCADHKGG